MANFKLIVSNPYDGRSNSYELKDDVAQSLLGLHVGSILEASNLGIKGKIKISFCTHIVKIQKQEILLIL